jgi:hypothetical protein
MRLGIDAQKVRASFMVLKAGCGLRSGRQPGGAAQAMTPAMGRVPHDRGDVAGSAAQCPALSGHTPTAVGSAPHHRPSAASAEPGWLSV